MVTKRGKRQRVTILVAIALFLTGYIAVGQQVEKITKGGTRFLLYTPPSYMPGGSYPLLIVLHGQGGLGDNLNKLRQRDETPTKLIAEGKWPSSYPFIIVSPQLKRDESVPDPADQKWPPEMVDEVVEQVRSEYAVDGRRIYITGLSQGAHGSYDYAVAYPQKIAAAVFISGVPDSTVACTIKDIPVWVFHGSDDRLVPRVFASGLVRALNDCSPKGRYRPRLNLLYGRNHEGWNEVYNGSNGYEIYDWMLKFTKNDPSNTPPYVSAGKELTLVNRSQPIRLYGDFFDSDGSISQVSWRQVSGAAATLEDTRTSFLKLSNLSPGAYEFELAVTDNNGARATDRVKLNIVSGTSGLAVTELVLMNGKYEDIAALREGYVVNPEDLFRNEINIRVNVNGNAGSVQYSINSNLNARTTDDSPFRLAYPRWTVEQGDYVICATPYGGPEATGAEGISQCYQIVVSATATEEPVDPEEPEEPVDPEEPEEPVDPEEPEEPVDPEEPEEPVDPEEPEEPVDPEEPEEPVDPEEPEEPVDPEEPEEPVIPGNHFYAKAGTDISQLSSWSSNPEGTGTSPASFDGDDRIYDVAATAELNNALAIGGTGSILRVRSGGELVLNHNLAAEIHMEAEAVLHVNGPYDLHFGILHPSSLVHFNADATIIPPATYGNVSLNGNGSVKTLAPGITRVAGNLTIGQGVLVRGAAAAESTLALSGDLNLLSNESLAGERPFTILFENTGTQQLSLASVRGSLHEVAVSGRSVVNVIGAEEKNILELGSENGGGLIVEDGGTFMLNRTDLIITGNGSLNAGNETGRVGFRQSSLGIVSSTTSHLNLYVVAGSDSLHYLNVNLTGMGELVLHTPLYVVDEVNVSRGAANSDGHLALVSTAEKTARIAASDGNGKIKGDVVFQRYIPKGEQTRYIGFPVTGITVQALQSFIPVTGNFTGASPSEGSGQSPSLFYFQDNHGGWIAFPDVSNTETFKAGQGYAVSIPGNTNDMKVIVSGPLLQGEFTYSLTPNANNEPSRGWNLIANPYASPIGWAEGGWTSQGVGTAAYILDDRYPGGRFLVWDGDLGDPEFSGLITQGQGFFVRTTSDSPVLTINESAKADTTGHLSREKEAETHLDHLVVTLKKSDLIDRTYVKFSQEGVNEFDASDAVKRQNGYFSLSTLSADSVSLAINHVQKTFCDKTIPLVLDAGEAGSYALVFDGSRFEADDAQINLNDHFTGETIPLHPGLQFSFAITSDPASYGENRFSIHIPSGTLEDPVIALEGHLLNSNISLGNQWLLDGEEIPGATESTYTPEVPGEYSLRVTVDGCTRISEPLFVNEVVTGIHESRNRAVVFYPNPATDFIRIQLQTGGQGHFYYVITNALGMRVADGELAAAEIMSGSEIEVRQLPSGVYFLNLRTTSGNFQTKFIVESGAP